MWYVHSSECMTCTARDTCTVFAVHSLFAVHGVCVTSREQAAAMRAAYCAMDFDAERKAATLCAPPRLRQLARRIRALGQGLRNGTAGFRRIARTWKVSATGPRPEGPPANRACACMCIVRALHARCSCLSLSSIGSGQPGNRTPTRLHYTQARSAGTGAPSSAATLARAVPSLVTRKTKP